MESNYPGINPSFQYSPPPPNNPYVQYFSPPSEFDNVNPNSTSCSSDCNTPTWVIVCAVLAALILCFFIYYYIKKREKKLGKSSAQPPPTKDARGSAAPPATKKTAESSLVPSVKAPIRVPVMSFPHNCPECGHRGGLYSLSYTCPWCYSKREFASHISGKK